MMKICLLFLLVLPLTGNVFADESHSVLNIEATSQRPEAPISEKMVLEGLLEKRVAEDGSETLFLITHSGRQFKIQNSNSVMMDNLNELIHLGHRRVKLSVTALSNPDKSEGIRILNIEASEKSDWIPGKALTALEEILGHAVPAKDKTPGELATAQTSQLKRIYSHNPSPGLAQFPSLKPIPVLSNPFEEDLLKVLYQDRYPFYELAQRDSNKDGIRDFAVGEYYGKVFELDMDADGDGIDNYFDADPFDPKVGGKDLDGDLLPDIDFLDKNTNKIPDHVDFEILGRSAEICAIQKRIFDKFKILIVEKDTAFTLEAAQAVEFCLMDLFQHLIEKLPKGPRSLLRVIATEKDALLFPEGEDATFAIADGYTKSLTLYDRTLNSSGPLQVAVIAHELAHTFQFTHDSYKKQVNVPVSLNPHENFEKSMLHLGWASKIEAVKNPPFQSFHGFWDEPKGPSYTYKGRDLGELKSWLESKREAFNKQPILGKHYLEDPEIANLHIVNDYAVSDILEFHSEVTTAAFWIAVQDRLAIRLTEEQGIAKEAGILKARGIMNQLLDADSSFKATRYEMARGSDYLPVITAWLAPSEASLDKFIDRYRLNLK